MHFDYRLLYEVKSRMFLGMICFLRRKIYIPRTCAKISSINENPQDWQVVITEIRTTFLFSAMTPSRNARMPNKETVRAIR
jgi:hypothetical protein